MKKPDMFADPEGYERWDKQQKHLENEIFRMAARREHHEDRVNRLLTLARQRYGKKFDRAYIDMIRLRKTQKNRAAVTAIFYAHSPGLALMKWHAEHKLERRVS